MAHETQEQEVQTLKLPSCPLQDVETLAATVDLNEVRAFRASMASLQEQASAAARPATVHVPFALCNAADAQLPLHLTPERTPSRCVFPASDEVCVGVL